MMEPELIDNLYESLFQNASEDDLLLGSQYYNSIDYHNMTSQHTEILGSFLDYTNMTPEELKLVLLRGYVASFN